MNGGVIIGAGVASLTEGIFSQNLGTQLPIFERNPGGSLGNNFLWIAPNGQRILAHLGLSGVATHVIISPFGTGHCSEQGT